MAVDGVDDVVVAPAKAPSVGADQRIGGFLGEPSLSDLFQASEVLGPVRGINLSEFVEAVHVITGEDKDELGALFVRIDGKDDGSLSWDEILSYLHQQQLCRLEPKHDQYESTQYTCLDRKAPPAMGMHKEPVYTLAYVERCCSYVTASHDGSMRVWHADTLQLALTRRLSDRAEVSVNAMHQLPQSFAKLAVATADRMVTFFELADLPKVSRWSVHGRIYTEEIPISLASFTVGSGDVLQCFAIGDVKGKVHIYDAVRLMERLWTELDRAHQVKRSAEPRPLAEKTIKSCLLITLSLHEDWVSQIEYAASIKCLLTSSLDASVRVTSVEIPASFEDARLKRGNSAKRFTGRADAGLPQDYFRHSRTLVPPTHKGVHAFVHGTTHGRHQLASCGLGRQVFVWSLESGDLLNALEWHGANVTRLQYDPISDLLISLDAAGEMCTWDFATLVRVHTMPLRPNAVERPAAILYENGQQVLVTADRRPRLWVQPKKFVSAAQSALGTTLFVGHQHPLVGVLYSPHFLLVVSGDENGLICVWDALAGVQRVRFEHDGARLTSLAFDTSGRRLVTGSADGSVRLWNYSSGELLHILSYAPANGTPPPSSEVSALVHIHQSSYNCYAAAGWGGEIWLWPAPALEQGENPYRSKGSERQLHGRKADVLCLAYCAPALLLATGAIDGEITIWSIVSGGVKATLTWPLEEEPARARCVDSCNNGGGPDSAVQPRAGQGGSFWTGGVDKSVECIAFLDPSAHALAAAPTLVSGGADGHLRVWNIRAIGGGTGHAFAVRSACAPTESLTALGVSESNDSLATGDSEGRVVVWDMSALVAAIAQRKPVGAVAEDERHLVRKASWRAHHQVIVQVEMVRRREVLITASIDGSVVMWTLCGARIGAFGQSKPWNMDQPPQVLQPMPAAAAHQEEGTAGASATAGEAHAKGGEAESGAMTGPWAPGLRASRSASATSGAWSIGARQDAGTMGASELRKVLRDAHASRFGEGAAASLAAATLAAYLPSGPTGVAARGGSRSEELIARLLPPPTGSAHASRTLRSPSRAALVVAGSLPPLEAGPATSSLATWRKRGLGVKAFAPAGWAPESSLASADRAGPRPPPLVCSPPLVLLTMAVAAGGGSPTSTGRMRSGYGKSRRDSAFDSGDLSQIRGSSSLPNLWQHGPR